MARNITLQFGLISLAAKADTATVTPPVMANLCTGQPGNDTHDPVPLTAPKQCATCGPIVDYDNVVKGVKSGHEYRLVDTTELNDAKESYAKDYVGLVNLVPHPAAEFLADTAPGETLHYLTPADAMGEGHYQLMVKLIESHPELAFASLHTPKSATGLYQVRVRDGVLVLEQRTRSQALKPPPSVGGAVNDALYAMLEGALATFVTAYDPEAYEDRYAAALDEMVAAGSVVTVQTDHKPVLVAASDDDLMTKLRALQAVA